MVPELLPGVGIMHHSWKAGLEDSMHFVNCRVPIRNFKHVFVLARRGLFLSVQIPALQIQLLH